MRELDWFDKHLLKHECVYSAFIGAMQIFAVAWIATHFIMKIGAG